MLSLALRYKSVDNKNRAFRGSIFVIYNKAVFNNLNSINTFIEIIFFTFVLVMNKFVPHSIDYDNSFEGEHLGDVKAGFPSPAEDVREKLDLIKLLVKHKEFG